MRLWPLLVGFATAVGLRVLLGGSDPAGSVPAALVFAAALLALCLAARPRVVLSVRGLALGVLGIGVICLPVVVHRTLFDWEPLRGTTGFVPWFAAVTVVVAAEELFLRGAVFEAVARPWVAVVVGAVCFALLHVPLYGWHVVPLDLAVGLVLGGLRVEAGTPLAPFVAHLGADAVGWFVA
jgi:hypothetical protein